MMAFAFDYSEEIHLPVLMRVTTRMAHSRAVVEVAETPRQENELNYNAKASDWVLLPAFARKRNIVVTSQQKELEENIRNWLWRKSNEPNQGFAETGHQGIE